MSRITKIFTIIFLIGSIMLVALIAYTLYFKATFTDPDLNFVAASSTKYVNYFLDRTKFNFYVKDDKFIIETKNNQKAEFKKDSLVDKFLEDWGTGADKTLLFPNSKCDYVMVSIPYSETVKSTNIGGVIFECTNSIDQKTYLNLFKINAQ